MPRGLAVLECPSERKERKGRDGRGGGKRRRWRKEKKKLSLKGTLQNTISPFAIALSPLRMQSTG
jgi:hypothetical protein